MPDKFKATRQVKSMTVNAQPLLAATQIGSKPTARPGHDSLLDLRSDSDSLPDRALDRILIHHQIASEIKSAVKANGSAAADGI